MIHRRAYKGVYNQAWKLSHSIHAISYSFILPDFLYKLARKSRVSDDYIELLNYIPLSIGSDLSTCRSVFLDRIIR